MKEGLLVANKKYYYCAVVWFGHNGGIYGDRHSNIKDCKNDLQYMMDRYMQNDVVFMGIKKFDALTNKEFICPQSQNNSNNN